MMRTRVRDDNELTIADPAPVTLSVIPAIDALVAEMAGRELVAGAEIIDRLLDLRLVAVADETLANCH